LIVDAPTLLIMWMRSWSVKTTKRRDGISRVVTNEE